MDGNYYDKCYNYGKYDRTGYSCNGSAKERVVRVNEDGSFVTEPIEEISSYVTNASCEHPARYLEAVGKKTDFQTVGTAGTCYKERLIISNKCNKCQRRGIKTYSPWVRCSKHRYPACMLIGTASVAASSGVELHEFFNANGERVMYPLATFDEDPDLSTSGPQDQVSVGQIIETEDGKEIVIAVDGQGAYVTEVIDQ